jgi:hypothetical protein
MNWSRLIVVLLNASLGSMFVRLMFRLFCALWSKCLNNNDRAIHSCCYEYGWLLCFYCRNNNSFIIFSLVPYCLSPFCWLYRSLVAGCCINNNTIGFWWLSCNKRWHCFPLLKRLQSQHLKRWIVEGSGGRQATAIMTYDYELWRLWEKERRVLIIWCPKICNLTWHEHKDNERNNILPPAICIDRNKQYNQRRRWGGDVHVKLSAVGVEGQQPIPHTQKLTLIHKC